MSRVQLAAKQIEEAFSSHKFELTYAYLSDDVRWDNVGGEQIHGKDRVIHTCEQSAQYLATVSTKFSKFKTMVGENCVVIDGTANYIDADNNVFTVASCDIYQFTEGKVSEITSYTVELNKH